MQGKHCKMSVYTIILSTDPLIRQIASYNIPPLGFTKVGYLENEFDNEKRLVKVLPKLMFTADM